MEEENEPGISGITRRFSKLYSKTVDNITDVFKDLTNLVEKKDFTNLEEKKKVCILFSGNISNVTIIAEELNQVNFASSKLPSIKSHNQRKHQINPDVHVDTKLRKLRMKKDKLRKLISGPICFINCRGKHSFRRCMLPKDMLKKIITEKITST
ncbi:unnamed protein product [Ceutorhynchus assimilis]|uniref:Uncharacterized protein n=1 Tax=Ceutorhynchus assimilis TaxID=467358 RepID=A0A9N9MEK2_9CUCU|nr:unnamed protein product [Ceutorhynchus assimilis]